MPRAEGAAVWATSLTGEAATWTLPPLGTVTGGATLDAAVWATAPTGEAATWTLPPLGTVTVAERWMPRSGPRPRPARRPPGPCLRSAP